MTVEVKIPAVGESVQEAMIHKWHKNSGDFVEVDDVLLEVETDKATVEVVAEADGVLETLRNEGDTVGIGDTIAKIDTAAKGSKPKAETATPPASTNGSTPPQTATPASSQATTHLSPAVNRMVNEHGLNSNAIAATGPGGRITKEDVVNHMSQPPSTSNLQIAKSPDVAQTQISGERTERRQPMSMLRRRIAERLVQAQHTAAILTTFNEIDLHNFIELRNKYKDNFKETHGIGLGFMSIFVKAAVEALKSFPAINGWIEGNEIVYHDYYDIGVAVSSDKGLVVPVIRDVDKQSFAEVEKSIAAYATKAREGKISVDDMSGGTFTVSNGGVFGSLLSTPIINPPQSAILGMHKTQQRPVVVNGEIAIRPMMYVALSYDHRIVDGKEAVQFLVKIKESVEDPQRLLLGV